MKARLSASKPRISHITSAVSPPDVETEIVECLQIGLVQGVPDDLNVHLVKILLVDAALEEGGQWSVYQYSVVELCRGARDVDGLHLFETTERMTFSNQLGDWSLVKSSSDEQHDVVDHVAVGDEVKEHGELAGALVPHMLKLSDEFLPQLVLYHGHLEAALVVEEVAVVGGLQMQLEVLQGLALYQIEIIILPQDPVLESPAQALQVAVINVEHATLHIVICNTLVEVNQAIL